MKFKFSLLRWAGGKYHALNKLLPLLDWRKNYCEVFGGGISVLLNKRKSSTEVINDINREWFNFWNVIRTRREEYEERIRFVFSGNAWLEQLDEEDTEISRAIAFYIRNRNAYGGFGDFNTRKELVLSFANNPIVKDVEWWSKRLQHVRIYELDYKDLLIRLLGKDTKWLIFCDPPYDKEAKLGTKMYKDKETGDVGFTDQDHVSLASLLYGLSLEDQQIFLTYGDSPLIRELYPEKEGWHLKEVKWHYHAHPGSKKHTHHELFISNTPFRNYTQISSVQKWEAAIQ